MHEITPKILIPLPSECEKGMRTYILRGTYVEKLAQHNAEIFPVPPSLPRHIIDEMYEQSSGIFLVGGPDIDPSLYAEERDPKTQKPDPARDSLELLLTKRALLDKKPFFGICRGSQMLTIAAGGTLEQDIPAGLAGETHGFAEHQYQDLVDKEENTACVVPDSRLAGLLHLLEIHIVCAHHQAIETVPPILKVAARTKGGIVEAVEHVDRRFFCFGVQSHPETQKCSKGVCGDLEPLFGSFVEAAREYERTHLGVSKT